MCINTDQGAKEGNDRLHSRRNSGVTLYTRAKIKLFNQSDLSQSYDLLSKKETSISLN